MQFDILLLQDLAHCPNCWLKVLAMLLAAILLGLLLGYIFWYRYQALYNELEGQHEDLNNRFKSLEEEFAALKYKYDEAVKDSKALKSSLNSCEADKATLNAQLARLRDASGQGDDAGKMALGAVPVTAKKASDDLKKIEGIGPKIEQLLNNAGIHSFRELAETNVERIQEILDAAGDSFRLAKPNTWPKQAEMAADGRWDELKAWQDELNGGRDDVK
jgi:predicted flap endonuclease-1-like 5' DNA nuclease